MGIYKGKGKSAAVSVDPATGQNKHEEAEMEKDNFMRNHLNTLQGHFVLLLHGSSVKQIYRQLKKKKSKKLPEMPRCTAHMPCIKRHTCTAPMPGTKRHTCTLVLNQTNVFVLLFYLF